MIFITRIAGLSLLGALVPILLVATSQMGSPVLQKLTAALAAIFWPGGSILYAIFVLDPARTPGERWDWAALAQCGLLNAVVYGLWGLTIGLLVRRNSWWIAAAVVPALFVCATVIHLGGVAASF